MDRVLRFKNLNIKILIHEDKYFNRPKYFIRPIYMSILQKYYSSCFRLFYNHDDVGNMLNDALF